MQQIKTIAEVITALDEIIKDCIHTQSRAGYFAALYKRMTVAVSQGIINGHFEDGPRMEALDVIFANRYLTAYNAFKNGDATTSSWKCAFGGCSNQSLIVLQHLLLGINTHINLDLAIAAATVAPGAGIHALQNDFNRINLLIATLVDDVQHCLEQVWLPMRLFRNIVNKQGTAVLNFSIEAAREAAWANAVKLAFFNDAQKATHIQAMDKAVSNIGLRIINPGAGPAMILRLVRWTEYEDAGRTIRLIYTTVVN